MAMPPCAPVDRWSGDLDDWSLSESSYVSLVRETATVANRHGRAAVFLGFALAHPLLSSSHMTQSWYQAAGQRWAADKSGFW